MRPSCFFKAWSEGENDFERLITAYYVARHQKNSSEKLKWLETSLQFPLKLNDASVKSVSNHRIGACSIPESDS
ncbi:hypothetical protein GCM10010917_41480 [Paenibacillus physcomitrellae]|uniref:Uncharacterized protein n=1 Tax=Paenibacillus physcomitrellae TaxID=1619311 RepID=A0ABQ1GXL7_9BACL|nr:hypothetical protein GCM10010917_41480 [Paenibacillus physcomitrellae]